MLPQQDIPPNAAPALPSLIESPTDNPATENRQNKSYDKIKNNNNDRPDDDNDDVDCFPRQDKQPVLPQDLSYTAPTANANSNNTSPSLIESPMDTPTAPMNTDNNNNIRRATSQTKQSAHCRTSTPPRMGWHAVSTRLQP